MRSGAKRDGGVTASHEPGTFIQTDGARLYVRDLGEGPAIVFVHGWALDLDMWSPQLADLSAEHRTIAFDRRGFGRSSGVPSIAADVEDLRAVLHELDVRKPLLVGMSQGARVVARFAAAYPHLISALVLDGAPPPAKAASHAADIPLDGLRERARRDGVQAVRREWLAHPFTKLHTQAEAIHALVRAMIERYPGADLLMPLNPLEQDIDPVTLRVPVLVINGEYDSQERLAAGEHLVHTIRGAERLVVRNAGHLANLDNPIAYDAGLRAFEAAVTGTIE